MSRTSFAAALALLGAAFVGASATSAQVPEPAGRPGPNVVSIANPASVHCADIGGRLEFRTEKGGQAGYCHLKDGRICEEWALFRDKRCVRPKGPKAPKGPSVK